MVDHCTSHGILENDGLSNDDLLREIEIHYLHHHKIVIAPDLHQRINRHNKVRPGTALKIARSEGYQSCQAPVVSQSESTLLSLDYEYLASHAECHGLKVERRYGYAQLTAQQAVTKKLVKRLIQHFLTFHLFTASDREKCGIYKLPQTHEDHRKTCSNNEEVMNNSPIADLSTEQAVSRKTELYEDPLVLGHSSVDQNRSRSENPLSSEINIKEEFQADKSYVATYL